MMTRLDQYHAMKIRKKQLEHNLKVANGKHISKIHRPKVSALHRRFFIRKAAEALKIQNKRLLEAKTKMLLLGENTEEERSLYQLYSDMYSNSKAAKLRGNTADTVVINEEPCQ